VISIVVSNFSIVASVALYVLVPLLLAFPAAIRPTTRTSAPQVGINPGAALCPPGVETRSRQTEATAIMEEFATRARYVTCAIGDGVAM